MSNRTHPQANVSIKLAVSTATQPGGGAVSNLIISKCLLVPHTLDSRVVARPSATLAQSCSSTILVIWLLQLLAEVYYRDTQFSVTLILAPIEQSHSQVVRPRTDVLFYCTSRATLPFSHTLAYIRYQSSRYVQEFVGHDAARLGLLGFSGLRRCEIHARLIAGVRRRLD